MTVGANTAPASPASSAFVAFEEITKTFGATRALRGVSFEIRPGETVGLLGANGAGKSTLIKTLSGIHPPTSGRIIIEGEEKDFRFPVDARNAGIATVHQNIDDGVVFGMTVAENLLLDEIATSQSSFFIRNRTIVERAREVQEKLDLDLPLNSLIQDLPASGRQEVAIAREISKNPKLLILDEPTSTLSKREAEKLFLAVEEFQRRGITILFISHSMSEVERLCDRAVVLRDGMIVSEHEKPLDSTAIAGSILGELVLASKHEARPGKEVVIEAKGLRAFPESPPVSVEIRRGEILGLTGLIGAGKTELLEQICGHRPLLSGTLSIEGEEYNPKDVSDAMKKGVVMVPEQRALQSMFPNEPLWKHSTIGLAEDFSRSGFMLRRREIAFTEDVIRDFQVKAPGPLAEIEELSGGNQQKLLVGRWLSRGWKLLVLDEPFRGIDIGARGLISSALRQYSEKYPVIVCSSDPEEVIEVADRALIMVEADIVHEDNSANLTAETLAQIMGQGREAQTTRNVA